MLPVCRSEIPLSRFENRKCRCVRQNVRHILGRQLGRPESRLSSFRRMRFGIPWSS